MKPVIKYAIIIAVVLGTVVLVRFFLIESYRIDSDRLSETLKAGDRVFVNKLKIGDNPGSNRMILYKSPLKRDAENPPLFTGRCVGLPGDVIRVSADGFKVNGRLLPNAPLMQPTFRIRKDIKTDLFSTMSLLNIPQRDVVEDSVSITLRLSLKEKDLLTQNLSKIINMEIIESQQDDFEFVIPRKGYSVTIDPTSLSLCKEAIINELGSAADILNGKLFVNKIEKKIYVFRKDYYWVLSENETEGIDSRHLGLIPKDHVIGNIWFRWYSKNPSNSFTKI